MCNGLKDVKDGVMRAYFKPNHDVFLPEPELRTFVWRARTPSREKKRKKSEESNER